MSLSRTDSFAGNIFLHRMGYSDRSTLSPHYLYAEYSRFNAGFQYSEDEADDPADPLLRPSSSADRRQSLPSVSQNWRRAWRSVFKVGSSEIGCMGIAHSEPITHA